MNYILERRTDGTIIWTEDQISYIKNQYNQNYSTGELAKLFSTSTASIRRCLQEAGVRTLTIQQLQHKKHPRRSDYFSVIDTESKAYWLGFLFADGSVGEKRNTVSITLKRDDEYMLKNLSAELGTNNVISRHIKKMGDKTFELSHFALRDDQIKRDLIKLGCVPNKSEKDIRIPSSNLLPPKFIWHFIRGFMDGDGSINHSNKNLRLSFTSNSEKFLLELRGLLKKDNLALDKHKTPMLVITGSKQLRPILDNIYKDSNNLIRLDRKYKIYINHYGLCA